LSFFLIHTAIWSFNENGDTGISFICFFNFLKIENSIAMYSLTQEQKNKFARVIERLGLAADAHVKQYEALKEAQSKKKNLVFSSDPIGSDVPPLYVSVGSVAEFKSKIGVEDGEDDSHIEYPPRMEALHADLLKTATSKGDLLSKMDETMANNMRKAAHAYVMGDSRKVMEYEPLINKIMFPGKIAVFAGGELDIPAGQTYTIQGDDPVVWNYEIIKEGQGSEIKITTMATVTSQYFIQQ
jgi:hypothetical protein